MEALGYLFTYYFHSITMKCCLVVPIPVENLSRRKGLRMNELTSAAWLEPNCKFVFKFDEIFNNCFTTFKSLQQIIGKFKNYFLRNT